MGYMYVCTVIINQFSISKLPAHTCSRVLHALGYHLHNYTTLLHYTVQYKKGCDSIAIGSRTFTQFVCHQFSTKQLRSAKTFVEVHKAMHS